jgi:electron transfer flavoprotein beta subunit
MRVAAVVEQAWAPASIELAASGTEIDWTRAAPEPGPGSLEALELALGLGETAVFGLGPPPVEELLSRCLAAGGASATIAPDLHALADALAAGGFDLVLVPHRSGDHGAGAVAGTLAGLLDLRQATGVESLRVVGGEALVVRRLDRGEREQLAVPLPAVIAVEPGIVRPRTASPAALLAARSVPVGALAPEPGVPQPVFLGHRPPRPGPPRLPALDGTLPAEARIASVIGTAADGPRRELAGGSPRQVAERIARLLEERGYLTQNR